MRHSLPSSFAQAERQCGRRPQKKLRYATWLVRGTRSEIAIRHHDTNIVTFHADGRIVLDVDGWYGSHTTKCRLREILGPLGWELWSERGIWWLAGQTGPRYQFENGTTIAAAGGVSLQPAPFKLIRPKPTMDDLAGRPCGHMCFGYHNRCCRCLDRWWRCAPCMRATHA